MKKIINIAAIGFALLTPSFVDIAQAVKSPAAQNSSHCQVRVDNVHISDSMLKANGKNYIKANADAVCDIRMDQSFITVEIWKKGIPLDHKVKSFDKLSRGAVPAGKVFSNKSTTKECASGQISFYYAHARVIGVSNGVTVSSPWVPSPNSELICCGT